MFAHHRTTTTLGASHAPRTSCTGPKSLVESQLQSRPFARPPAPVSPKSTMFSFFKGKKRHSHITAATFSAGSAAPGSPVEVADAPANVSTAPGTSQPASVLSTQSLQATSSGCQPSGKLLRLATGACCLPHPDKVHYGGEDAYFVSDYGGGALGVADGVGGWQESGVNPAEYSRGLMKNARAYLEGSDIFAESAATRTGVLIDPRGALDAAHINTKVPGSATACVLQLDQANRTLVAANLGDSGFIIIRDGKELVKSKPLQHYFDCPLQFGAFPEFVEATDTADMADLYSISLRPGDIIVAGSDGLWDNCYIAEIISLLPKSPEQAERAASDIAGAARRHAADQDFASPYTREALAQGLDLPWWDKVMGMTFKSGRLQLKQLTGGKMDDITVIVSVVTEVDPDPARLGAEHGPSTSEGTQH